MLERTEKRPAEEMVAIRLRVHRSNAERIKRFIKGIEDEKEIESRPWREVFNELRPADNIPSAILMDHALKKSLPR
jgi:hypothetical protein